MKVKIRKTEAAPTFGNLHLLKIYRRENEKCKAAFWLKATAFKMLIFYINFLVMLKCYIGCIPVYLHFNLHHHAWRDSPLWALAFLRIFFQTYIFAARCLKFMILLIVIFCKISFSHFNFALPTFLVCEGCVVYIFFVTLLLTIRTCCPAQASLLISIYFT